MLRAKISRDGFMIHLWPLAGLYAEGVSLDGGRIQIVVWRCLQWVSREYICTSDSGNRCCQLLIWCTQSLTLLRSRQSSNLAQIATRWFKVNPVNRLVRQSSVLSIDNWSWINNNTLIHRVSKNVPPVACYNFDAYEWILIFLAEMLPIK